MQKNGREKNEENAKKKQKNTREKCRKMVNKQDFLQGNQRNNNAPQITFKSPCLLRTVHPRHPAVPRRLPKYPGFTKLPLLRDTERYTAQDSLTIRGSLSGSKKRVINNNNNVLVFYQTGNFLTVLPAGSPNSDCPCVNVPDGLPP